MASCHTALVDGYVIEGHVPATDIRRLLSERPDAIGLAVPEMPLGSPGMDQSDMREAYDVFLIRRDGSTEVFASYASN
ncbi:CopG family transcriptional regulator [Labrenzia sp. R4_2]|nr:CopG family transcriptional regulator [Labrenzia sp. R4_2]